MELLLKRRASNKVGTIGELFVNGKHECYICEDIIRPNGQKMFGETAIPAGTYPIYNTFSPRFGKYLPLLANVPGYAGIRIHPGNTPADTEGCLLPGTDIRMDASGVDKSVVAFNALFAKIKAVEKREKITITIVNPA